MRCEPAWHSYYFSHFVSLTFQLWPPAWLRSRIKRPTPNQLATQRNVNWPVVYPESSNKIMDPVSVALPQNHRRIFVATLLNIYRILSIPEHFFVWLLTHRRLFTQASLSLNENIYKIYKSLYSKYQADKCTYLMLTKWSSLIFNSFPIVTTFQLHIFTKINMKFTLFQVYGIGKKRNQ